MVKCSKNIFLSKSNNALQYPRIERVECQHQAGLRNDTSCKLFFSWSYILEPQKERSPITRNARVFVRGGEYQNCPPQKHWWWRSTSSRSLQWQVASWRVGNPQTAAVPPLPYIRTTQIFLLLFSFVQNVRAFVFTFFYSVMERIQQWHN